MYGGDIALTPEQQATLEATSNQNSPFSIQNAVVRSEQYLWKQGIVYYIFDDSLSEFCHCLWLMTVFVGLWDYLKIKQPGKMTILDYVYRKQMMIIYTA